MYIYIYIYIHTYIYIYIYIYKYIYTYKGYLANVLYSPGAEGGPVCKICPLILTLDPYWGPQGGLK